MKKLLTILAASAMFFAFGENIDQGVDFESYTATGEGSFNPYGVDVPNGSRYWYSASAVGNVISNHVEGALEGVPIPDLYADANSNTNFLFLETEAPLFRTVYPNGKLPDNQEQFQGYSIVENPIYLDTLVKFTAADDDNTLALEADTDKIAIAYVEREDNLETENINEALTNFVIRAGYLGSPLSQTNYYAAVPANFAEKKNGWHRLTVRSFGSIDEAGDVGFVVYLDGEPLAYDTAVEAGPNFTPKGAAAAFYTSSLHALFPSAVPANQTGGQEIAAVAFSGNGSIDDVVFTTETPKFIKDGEAVRTEITLGTGVAAVTVTVGEETITPEDATATPLVFNIPAGKTSFVLGVTADTTNGYTFDETTGINLTDATYNTENDTVTITGASPALTLKATRDNFDVYVGGVKTGSYSTLSAALTGVEDGSTIKLAYNYVVSDFEASAFTTYAFADKEIVLDLNGKVLDGGSSNDYYLFAPGEDGVLTVIDSGTGGKIVYGGTKGMFDGNLGDVLIGSTTLSDNGATFDGVLMGAEGWVSRIYRGKFSYEENTEGGAFVANSQQLAAGSTVTHEGDYWVVEPQGGSTTFALTTTGGANATVTTSPADVSALTEATEVTITATAAQDYTYDGVDLSDTDWTYDSVADAISMTTNISENTKIAVPDAVAEQPSDDWPTGQDLDDAAGKAAGDLFPGITNALATADAKAVATWAGAKGVDYADKGSILPEAFLLNCANTQAAIDEAAADFKITAITVDGDTVTITPADASTYENGKVVIESAAALTTPMVWREKTAGDHFFRATLVVKPVTP